ncbi:MAG TPA: hypothetical protein EYG21_03945 [Nitrospinaceae bacterium]|nr:hypothetical protein [Nitrospinaceae bacterium]
MCFLKMNMGHKIEKQIFKDKKLAFIHIPKNYGSSCMSILFGKEENGSHITADQLNKTKGFEDYKNFCFTRDPVDRFISTYIWRAAKGSQDNVEDVLRKIARGLVNKPEEKDASKADKMFNPQTSWMNENTVFIGRCEDFTNELAKLKTKFNLSFEIQEKNLNKTGEMGKRRIRRELKRLFLYCPELKNTFYNFYKNDFEKLGYDLNNIDIRSSRTQRLLDSQCAQGEADLETLSEVPIEDLENWMKGEWCEASEDKLILKSGPDELTKRLLKGL